MNIEQLNYYHTKVAYEIDSYDLIRAVNNNTPQSGTKVSCRW